MDTNTATPEEVEELPEPTAEDIATVNRQTQMLMHGSLREQSLKAERALKGVYCDWIFTNLNLTDYR